MKEIEFMKMLLMTAVFAFAPMVHAADAQPPQQSKPDMAAVCDAQMDQGQELTAECAARVSCLADDGQQTADCQHYCAANPADEDACAVNVDDAQAAQADSQMTTEMSRSWDDRDRRWDGRDRRWHGRDRRWHGRHRRGLWCDLHPLARGCW